MTTNKYKKEVAWVAVSLLEFTATPNNQNLKVTESLL